MQLVATTLPPVSIVVPSRITDDRGFLSEVFNVELARALNLDEAFLQDNHSYSRSVGTVRGLHFQSAPFPQAKLVRVVRGAIYDVVVDIRHGSPTFGQYVAVELSEENWKQLFVPEGFAHGFCTLRDNTDVVYKLSKPYASDCEFGIRWNDAQLGIAWPVKSDQAVLSERDRNLPLLTEIGEYFRYEQEGA